MVTISKRSLSSVLFLALVLHGCGAAPGGSVASTVRSGGPIKIAQSVVSVEALDARIWAPPEAKFALLERVPDRSYYYWKMDDVPMASFGPSPILTAEGSADYQTVHSTGSKFYRRVVKFARPRGHFLEILLHFRNDGDADYSREVSSKGSFASYIRLQNDGEPDTVPVDFLTPGLSNGRFDHLAKLQGDGLTVVSEHSGNLQLFLEPEGETWILLLFDVPVDSRNATLELFGSESFVFEW